jgi:hypothetical protein
MHCRLLFKSNKLVNLLIFSESTAEESCNPHTGRSHECPGRRIGKACSGLKGFSDRSLKLNTNYVVCLFPIMLL